MSKLESLISTLPALLALELLHSIPYLLLQLHESKEFIDVYGQIFPSAINTTAKAKGSRY